MSESFGYEVNQKAAQLLEQGKDANQTSKILFDQDPKGCNYGIGIALMGNGKPMPTAPTLLEYAAAELENSGVGTYMNSNAQLEKLKEAVLKWQRVPEDKWSQFALALPSDAGTGAVHTAIQLALLLNPDLNTLGGEELGWAAYKTLAKTSRLNFKEFATGTPIEGKGVLPMYQAGPMNTTGQVHAQEVIAQRAKAAATQAGLIILDRAYTGFEYATAVQTQPYDECMRKSYQRHLQPFVDQGITFALAISPTKAFASFALRPCGFLLLFSPNEAQRTELINTVNSLLRARGSSFEHPTSRALAKVAIQELPRLEQEHQTVLKRIADAEAMWRTHTKGTAMEELFTDAYAGLFRNPKAKEGAAVQIYNEHLYPVFSGDRCRLNITGIPDDGETAARHVRVFAEQCI